MVVLLVGVGAALLSASVGAQEEPARSPESPESQSPESQSPAQACRATGFVARMLTSSTDRIPRDAALVVSLVPGGPYTELPAIGLQRRRRTTPLLPEQIAPGLFRLRPDARRIYGRWDVTGIPNVPPLVFGRPGVGAPPVQPELRRVERYMVASLEGSFIEVRAHLRFPVPSGVVAAVTYWGSDAEPDGFALTIPASQEVVLSRQTGECMPLPPGASAAPESGDVRISFVDRYGQVSPISAPATL